MATRAADKPTKTPTEQPTPPAPKVPAPSQPSEAPPAPSEVAEEPVKVGRRNMSVQEADRATRYARREALHAGYGTTSGRKVDEGAPRS